MKRIVICLDGTWNSAGTESETRDADKVFKPSNVLKTSRAVVPQAADGTHQLTYYDSGVGAGRKYPGFLNGVNSWVDKKTGGAKGAGYEANVEDAYRFLVANYQDGDELYIFGFSRGAAQARTLTNFMDWMGGLLRKSDDYWLPRFFDVFLEGNPQQGFADARERCSAATRTQLAHKYGWSGEKLEKETARRVATQEEMVRPAPIAYLGVWDTVAAVGERKGAFYVSHTPAANIRHVRHALAIDEWREDFLPSVFTRPAAGTEQHLEQKWFAGAHSDVGGGYIQDGLANCALRWVLEPVPLETNPTILQFYRPYPQDRLHKSKSAKWYALEWLRLRFKKGVRSLSHPASSNSSVHRSALQRLAATPGQKHKELTVEYRPDNLLAHLAALPDLAEFLAAEWPGDDDKTVASRRRIVDAVEAWSP